MNTPTIHTDPIHLIAYATDASAYREMPKGVSYPANDEEVRQLILYAHQHHTHLIPRAGGTSIAGQVVGDGIVVDISRHFNKILEINADERWVRVQPGVVRDELNIALKPYGLFFSPETSTSNRCCIGGMVGNNSCGTHSLIYGSTRHHLLQIKGFLSDGSPFDTSAPNDSPIEQAIRLQLRQWHDNPAIRQLITTHFPDSSLTRRSCGYAIDEALDGDLCKLICGSEGTLCFITEIKLSLDPLPPAKQMVLCAHCDSLPQSYQANLVALRHHPSAVELMDGKILELCKTNISQRKNRFFIQGEPAALLIAEFNGDSMDQAADATEKELLSEGLAYHCSRVYGSDISRVWALRKAGLGVLTGVIGDEKPIGVVEDTAVHPSRLPDYLGEFDSMLKQHGLQSIFYGHIGTGELHLRPIINIKTPEGRKLFRTIAYETALLVKKHHGSLSGEHGDGRLRGEFIPIVYGEEAYQLMREVKHCWDPDGIFNRGKIIDTPKMDSFLRYDAKQQYICGNSDLMLRIEQCNGAGDCRKSNLIGGTMCPAFKVSHDELKTTRARANILRELLTRGMPDGSDPTPVLEEILYSCLACKGCKSECPSNVDMTRIRAEVLQQLYDQHHTPLRSWMVARMASVERFGHLFRPFYNYFATASWSSAIIKKIVQFAPERDIPTLSKQTLRQWQKKEASPSSQRRVYLFADEFTNLQEAQLGKTFVLLLQKLGYQVIIPRHVESGRAAISKGCLHLASRYAEKNVKQLAHLINDQTPLVGIEPSCILSFRDEYPRLVSPTLREKASLLAKNCLLYDEFIMREVAAGHISKDQFLSSPLQVWLHGHCHQKALVGIEKTAAMLHLLPGIDLHIIPSSCCGMAGSFGYEKEHYKTSIAIGEMILFPTIRKAVNQTRPDTSPTFIAAPGTSCRQQILDGTGIHAVHPIEIMNVFVKPSAEANLDLIMPRQENDCCKETNVFVKPQSATPTDQDVPFHLYKQSWIYLGSADQEPHLTSSECRKLLKKGGLMVRNVHHFDCESPTLFWYVIKDQFGGMDELSSKMRNQVRRSQANFEFRRITPQELLDHGYPIHQKAAENYRIKAEIPSQDAFREQITNSIENDFWGAYRKTDGTLVAFAKNILHEHSCNYSVLKADPEALKQYVYYGLIYEMNRYYLEECGLLFVNDGARSISNHSNIQPFLIDKFHFRKAYCQLEITYVWWLKCAVKLLYPFRKLIPLPTIKNLLYQEAMQRGNA